MANQTVQSCAKCKKNINLRNGKPLQCDGKCKQWFHKACTSVSDAEYQEIQSVPDKFWFCIPCKDNRNKSRRSTINMADQPLLSTPNGIEKVAGPFNMESVIGRIESKLDKLICWQKEVITEVRGIQNTLGELRTTTETLMDEQQQLREQNDELRRKVEWCEIEIDKQKQEQLGKSLEVSNIPVIEGEDLFKIVNTICEEISVDLRRDDVEGICRAPSNVSIKSQLPPSILVRFHSKEKRDEIMAKKKSKRDLTTSVLNISAENSRNVNIYINEVLTRRNRYLFKMARDLKRNGKVKFAWFRDGRLLVRKTEKGRVREVFSSDILNEYSK